MIGARIRTLLQFKAKKPEIAKEPEVSKETLSHLVATKRFSEFANLIANENVRKLLSPLELKSILQQLVEENTLESLSAYITLIACQDVRNSLTREELNESYKLLDELIAKNKSISAIGLSQLSVLRRPSLPPVATSSPSASSLVCGLGPPPRLNISR